MVLSRSSTTLTVNTASMQASVWNIRFISETDQVVHVKVWLLVCEAISDLKRIYKDKCLHAWLPVCLESYFILCMKCHFYHYNEHCILFKTLKTCCSVVEFYYFFIIHSTLFLMLLISLKPYILLLFCFIVYIVRIRGIIYFHPSSIWK